MAIAMAHHHHHPPLKFSELNSGSVLDSHRILHMYHPLSGHLENFHAVEQLG